MKGSGSEGKSEELERYRAEAIARTRAWLHASSAERKRWAAEAVATRDGKALWEMFEAYLERSGVSSHTLRSYRYGLRVLLEAFESVDLLRAGPGDAERFLYDLRHPGHGISPAASTVRQRMSVASAFYAALRWSGVTQADPFRDVPRPKPADRVEDRLRGKAVRERELEALLWRVRDPDTVEVELEVVLLLGAHAGLRASEMLALCWGDVDTAQFEVVVRRGKGGRSRTVQMSRALCSALVMWRRVRGAVGEGDRVLLVGSQRGLYGKLERLWERTFEDWTREEGRREFAGVGVHGLRHYAGVRLAEESGDLRVVRDHLGHVSVQTTEGYASSASGVLVRDW